MNIFDKILSCIFRKYTYKVYRLGVKDGYNWHGCTKAVQELKTKNKNYYNKTAKVKGE